MNSKRLSSSIKDPHVKAGFKYAEDVISGKISACLYVRQACQRSIDDYKLALARSGGAAAKRQKDKWRYHFDQDRAGRVCRFIELLPHVKGVLSGQRIKLEPFQVWILIQLFGFVDQDGHRRFRRALIILPRGSGKALDITVEIPTLGGFRMMADLAVGDLVFGGDGKPCHVVATTDIMHDRSCYKIEFNTGETFIADADHQWVTDARVDRDRSKGVGGKNFGPRPSIKTTEEIAATLMCRADRNHRIDVTPPVEYEDHDYPIDPYVLGAWLGDGHSACGRITSADYDIINEIGLAGEHIRKAPYGDDYLYLINNGDRSQAARDLSFATRLRKLGLIKNKHVPERYMRGSFYQRLSLLQGLMDTDGTVSKQGQCSFLSTKKCLADAVLELVASLGLRPSIIEKPVKLNGRYICQSWQVNFTAYRHLPVFRLPRKFERQVIEPKSRGLQNYRQIIAADRVRSVPVKCIEVDSEDGTYLIGRTFIKTHNSTIASGIALYMLAADSNQADVYTAATSRDQAGIVFRDAQHMARTSPEMCAKLGIQVHAHQLTVPSKNSKFTFLSSESHGLDGLNVSLAVLDELAQHPDSRVYDAIVTGAGKRPNSLIFAITTAGSNQIGPGFQQQEYLRTVLDGTVEDEQMFGAIWTIDATDDWTKEESWRKANPGWGVSVEPTFVSGLAKKATQVGHDQVAFLQKHLCVWTAADSQFLDMTAWAKCADKSLTIEQFFGEPCWIGLDLASKVDLSARILLFRRMIDDDMHYYIFGRAYLPETAINGNATYAGWRMQDRLSVTPGEVTDFEFILGDLKDDCVNFDVRKIAVDPWQASWIMQRLLSEGAPAIEYRNNVATMSNPMKQLQAIIASGRLHHDGDPVLGWCMSNLVAHYDQKDNVFPRKNLVTQKIDLAVATIMAIGLEMAEESPMDFDGIIFVPFN